jgi:hypothetical protein
VSRRTHRGVTSEITAWYGITANYSVVVAYDDEHGVRIAATKNWITTLAEAEAIVAKYRARWERVPEEERTAARNAAILHDANHDCREAQR